MFNTFSYGDDQYLLIWDLRTPSVTKPIQTVVAHQSEAVACCQNEESEWRPAEAALFGIQSISTYVSVVEAEVMPKVLKLAWDRGLPVAGENALSCYDREGCMRILEMVKPRNDPDRHHFTFFVYQQPSPLVQGTICFPELDFFIKCMHEYSYGVIRFGQN